VQTRVTERLGIEIPINQAQIHLRELGARAEG
jgi:hypothetical protein